MKGKRIAVAVAMAAIVAAACSRNESPSASPSGTAPSAAAPPPAPDAAAAAASAGSTQAGSKRVDPRHACSRDADCLLSCGHGAVEARWYKAAHPGGEACEGGCASKGTTSRCDAGRCVAEREGVIVAGCTAVVKAVEPIGPHHRCATASDCRLMCKLGAVNARVGGLGETCRDGCSSKGISADCRDGACVAVRDGAVLPSCTRVSIWE